MGQILICLKCITNLHAGNGDVNYSIVDNEVERDAVTNYPMVNSSGVKGALREYFQTAAPDLIGEIFGSDEPGHTTPGKLRFLSAEMLGLAARASRGETAFGLVTTEGAVSRFNQMQSLFLGINHVMQRVAAQGVEIEGFSPTEKLMCEFGELYLLPEEVFRRISLPVLARNCLENGRSTNLWYEEVVPHESLFFFPVLAANGDATLLRAFAQQVDGKIIQFGGNASIGYGLCKATVMEAAHG